MNATEFFQLNAGRWLSQRVTHHLAFQRRETGDSVIQVHHLEAQDPQVVELCQMHEIDPVLAVSGALISWEGNMAWDKAGEGGHQGKTVMALVPDADSQGRSGQLLRERGYAETAPVVGRFHMDEHDALILTTAYETMTVFERFWFAGPNLRIRANTVCWFGGFSSASFCTEMRLQADNLADPDFTDPVLQELHSAQGVLACMGA
ncbi:MAG: phycobiliprotein lyase [Synechococcaceae cyanobacterium SM2_3_1]|nr:phycobiliprotein lyase [Synechococcaceae cyanobacterium SM2_3_1]